MLEGKAYTSTAVWVLRIQTANMMPALLEYKDYKSLIFTCCDGKSL